MGMFDDIEVDARWCPEPRPSWLHEPLTGAQTKSLDCDLRTYRVDADGQLSVRVGAGNYDDPGAPRTTEWWPQNFTGDVDFYYFPMFGHELHRTGAWYEARLTFVDGKVVAAERLKGLFG